MTKKMHRFIDLCFILFPLVLVCLNIFRNGDLNFTNIESDFSIFRRMDFNLHNLILTNMFGNNFTASPLLLLMIDIMIYFVYWRFFDLAYSCFAFAIDILCSLVNKWGGVRD